MLAVAVWSLCATHVSFSRNTAGVRAEESAVAHLWAAVSNRRARATRDVFIDLGGLARGAARAVRGELGGLKARA